MTQHDDRINMLSSKLELLLQRHEVFQQEIDQLRKEITELKKLSAIDEEATKHVNAPVEKESLHELASEQVYSFSPTEVKEEAQVSFNSKTTYKEGIKDNVEKFIGENLISKAGILITVLGVGIGAKYAIDHELISPVTRIILGYLVGIGLLLFAIKLKAKYENFSAVLLSGAMAIMYFISFAAYDIYSLIPQGFTFALMLVFTCFTVFAALKYDRQVIAHIGLVGAYAIPFLLSQGSGRVDVLFSYMTIINIGILIISIKRNWRALYYSAFALTWIIYLAWFNADYSRLSHFALSLIFSGVFFAIFYATFLAYKLLQRQKFGRIDIVLLLLNSFLFYGLGYAVLSGHKYGNDLLGIFTLLNAVIHLIVGIIIYRKKLADKNLFYFVVGLVLVFVTITIPVQLDGNWVTLLWAAETALLFWIGRTKTVKVYESLSYPLMLLAFFSLIHDWASTFINYSEEPVIPVFNIHFLSALLFCTAFGFIIYLNRRKPEVNLLPANNIFSKAIYFGIPAIFLFVLYNSLRLEIARYWGNELQELGQYGQRVPEPEYTYYYESLMQQKELWMINYSLLFLAALSFINIRKLKSTELANVNLTLNLLGLIFFLTQGLYALSELRELYIHMPELGIFHVLLRYISYTFLTLILYSIYQYAKRLEKEWPHLNQIPIGFDLLMHLSILWVVSSELIHWLDLTGFQETYKLGLSILWGLYSLLLIGLGIWKSKKHLRIAAILLFAVTLLKVFLYDISHLSTISKTVVFISLGILLLITSFLYNKYRSLIFGENEQ